MDFEFDPAKDKANIAKHGLSLEVGEDVILNALGEFEDDRFDYGERRIVAFGWVEGRPLVCVYTMRGETCRIISVRKATRWEQQQWLSGS